MKILTFSTLFPNSEKPGHGIFVETRLRHLVASGQVEARVVAPVPWFPSTHPRFGDYAKQARVPRQEQRHGITVLHPRYPTIPRIGMNVAPLLLAQAVKPVIARMLDEGDDFDLIDAHYFYPDGVAAAMLARHFNKPLVITARGSDITLIPQHPLPRRMIRWAARRADAVITVCNALRDEVIALGVDAARVTSLRNGVDLQLFRPTERLATKGPFTLLTVGHLVPVKAQELIIGALPLLPDVRLVVAGDGVNRQMLEDLARTLNVAERVQFLGAVPQAQLRSHYGAADALVLASSREGWANVLLESMACGTPVVASRVYGTPEVVAAPEAGVLMAERTPQGVADAVNALRARYPDRLATRRYAERFSWDDTTAGQLRLFDDILNRRQRQSSGTLACRLP
ncbi:MULTISPECIES: glycosyltransferase family 4 protein [unclassified Massilia]|uniref:glycosyltransferase family 4 protein n=1 Tax=unclassified Massilia TaxID=2609279 RepID=UPI00177ED032|nr:MULTISPECIES: glycosyltransferase family 4 protein [unclassified Massilia]MBD8531330.1 glycosyltransferase family 4 protein [Massilia sp. CFBP 13647]MBD8674415.1 glycosyltransferase family 4 protein [Massilia sp. CFBP 13721]